MVKIRVTARNASKKYSINRLVTRLIQFLFGAPFYLFRYRFFRSIDSYPTRIGTFYLDAAHQKRAIHCWMTLFSGDRLPAIIH